MSSRKIRPNTIIRYGKSTCYANQPSEPPFLRDALGTPNKQHTIQKNTKRQQVQPLPPFVIKEGNLELKAHVESDETGGERYCPQVLRQVPAHHPVPNGAGTGCQRVLVLLVPASLVPVLLVSLLVRLGAALEQFAGTCSRKSAANKLTPPNKYPLMKKKDSPMDAPPDKIQKLTPFTHTVMGGKDKEEWNRKGRIVTRGITSTTPGRTQKNGRR